MTARSAADILQPRVVNPTPTIRLVPMTDLCKCGANLYLKPGYSVCICLECGRKYTLPGPKEAK